MRKEFVNYGRNWAYFVEKLEVGTTDANFRQQ